MPSERLCMAFGKTTGDCTPVALGDDTWTQCVVHGPGNSNGPMKVINRSIIYRLHSEDSGDFLVVLNALRCDDASGEPCTSLRKLADALSAPVRFVLTPGSGHHLSLADYAKAFPDARVCIPAGRIERHNPDLVGLANVETYAADTVPTELAAAGLEVLLWEGFREGPAGKRVARMQLDFKYVCADIQPQTFLHRPSGTISNGGHHLFYRGEGDGPVFEGPSLMLGMFRLLAGVRLDYMVAGKVSLEPNGGFEVADAAKVQASAQRLLDWEFDRMIDFHSALDSHLDEGAHALFDEALEPVVRGEWSEVPWTQPRA